MREKFGHSAWRIIYRCSGAAGLLVVLLMCLLASAEEGDYRPKTAITDVSITNPTANEVWLAGSDHELKCSTSTDTDEVEDASGEWDDIADSVTHHWTGTGTFKDNDYVGTTVTYFCTNIAASNTVTVYANDNYVPESNDALYDETAKTDSETVSGDNSGRR